MFESYNWFHFRFSLFFFFHRSNTNFHWEYLIISSDNSHFFTPNINECAALEMDIVIRKCWRRREENRDFMNEVNSSVIFPLFLSLPFTSSFMRIVGCKLTSTQRNEWAIIMKSLFFELTQGDINWRILERRKTFAHHWKVHLIMSFWPSTHFIYEWLALNL